MVGPSQTSDGRDASEYPGFKAVSIKNTVEHGCAHTIRANGIKTPGATSMNCLTLQLMLG